MFHTIHRLKTTAKKLNVRSPSIEFFSKQFRKEFEFGSECLSFDLISLSRFISYFPNLKITRSVALIWRVWLAQDIWNGYLDNLLRFFFLFCWNSKKSFKFTEDLRVSTLWRIAPPSIIHRWLSFYDQHFLLLPIWHYVTEWKFWLGFW